MNTKNNNQKTELQSFYYKKDKLAQLKGFCSVVQHNNSATQASKELGVQPGTVCRQVNTLQNDLGGLPLFERSLNRRSKLTDRGKKLYNKALQAVNMVDSIFYEFSTEMEERRKNTLRIAGNYAFLSSKLPKYIKRMIDMEEFKNLDIEIMNVDTEEGFEGIKTGEIDVGFYPIITSQETPLELEMEKIFKWNSILLLSKKHPLVNKKSILPQDLKKYPYLFLDKYMFFNPSKTLELRPSNVRFRNGNWGLLCNFVKENIGMLVILEDFLDDCNFNDDQLTKINVNHFFPNAFFSIFTKKATSKKKSAEFLITEILKDKNL